MRLPTKIAADGFVEGSLIGRTHLKGSIVRTVDAPVKSVVIAGRSVVLGLHLDRFHVVVDRPLCHIGSSPATGRGGSVRLGRLAGVVLHFIERRQIFNSASRGGRICLVAGLGILTPRQFASITSSGSSRGVAGRLTCWRSPSRGGA